MRSPEDQYNPFENFLDELDFEGFPDVEAEPEKEQSLNSRDVPYGRFFNDPEQLSADETEPETEFREYVDYLRENVFLSENLLIRLENKMWTEQDLQELALALGNEARIWKAGKDELQNAITTFHNFLSFIDADETGFFPDPIEKHALFLVILEAVEHMTEVQKEQDSDGGLVDVREYVEEASNALLERIWGTYEELSGGQPLEGLLLVQHDSACDKVAELIIFIQQIHPHLQFRRQELQELINCMIAAFNVSDKGIFELSEDDFIRARTLLSNIARSAPNDLEE